MKISVVTPSYNQADFLERTLTSVIDQKYPDLEYLVVDGGSTDNSVEIIKRYEKDLKWWVSEKDRGQSNAINKGFARSTGDILCWLNSDDFLEPGTLQFVAEYFKTNPDVDALCGGIHTVDAAGHVIGTAPGVYGGPMKLATFWSEYNMHQASIFWRRRVYEKIGPLNETLHLTMDYDYWLRMQRYFQIRSVDRVLSQITVHPSQKTSDYSSYRRAQLRTVVSHYASPFSLRNWDIRLVLLGHLAKTAAKKALRRKTWYD